MALKYRNYYIYLDKQVIALLLIVITSFFISLSPQSKADVSGDTQNNDLLAEYRMQFFGKIDDPNLAKIVTSLYNDYFINPIFLPRSRETAQHIEIYIGSRFVEQNRFVPPVEETFSEAHLSAFEGKVFPSTGCKIERLHFPDRTFVVLLVDATKEPSSEKSEVCILGAILTALGEDLDGRDVDDSITLSQQIEDIIGRR